MTDKEEKELGARRELIRWTIADFFNTLYKDQKAAVQSVDLQWSEVLEHGKHDKYILMDVDTDVKL